MKLQELYQVRNAFKIKHHHLSKLRAIINISIIRDIIINIEKMTTVAHHQNKETMRVKITKWKAKENSQPAMDPMEHQKLTANQLQHQRRRALPRSITNIPTSFKFLEKMRMLSLIHHPTDLIFQNSQSAPE